MSNMGRSSRHRWWSACAVLIVLAAESGCYGVTSRHYFAVTDLDGPERGVTFYRVSVTARSFLTTSQYNAGFYDANALHQLFGEVKAPAPPAAATEAKKTESSAPAPPAPPAPPAAPTNTTTVTGTASSASSLQAGTVQVECDLRTRCRVTGGANDRFTVIYGANADALADQVRAFADSDNTGKQIASLLAASASADVFERTTAADQATEQARQNATGLAKDLKTLADQIANATSADEARKLLLRAAQLAAQRAGSSTLFDTTDPDRGFTQAQATYEVLSK
jgi:hypothetical protein